MAAVGGTLPAALFIAVQCLAVVTWPLAIDVNRALETRLEDSRLRPRLLEQAPRLPRAISTWAPTRSDTLRPAARRPHILSLES